MAEVGPRALVVLRVARNSPPPSAPDAQAALEADRARLALPASPALEHRIAGPYLVELDGRALDEYVVWEI